MVSVDSSQNTLIKQSFILIEQSVTKFYRYAQVFMLL